MPTGLGPQTARPITDARRLGPQFGIAHHFFHVAQPVGPVEEIVAPEGRGNPLIEVVGLACPRSGPGIRIPRPRRSCLVISISRRATGGVARTGLALLLCLWVTLL